MSIAALIFDFDGTIADTEEAHRQAFNAAFLEHSLFWNWSQGRYGELLGVSGGKERILAYIDGLPAGKDEKARLAGIAPLVHRSKTRTFAELVESGGVPLRPGIARLLREAHDRGVRLAIASTTTATNVEALLAATMRAEVRGWFDVIACGDIVPAKKPAPDIYELALASLGLPAGDCVAFEDSAKGLAAARAAGVRTIVTPTYWTASDDFTGAAAVLPGLGDPDAPLDVVSQRRVGAPYVGLAELARLLEDGQGRAAA
jgi:HAD superfamily hydrolase (TIGR01509 family)